MFPQSNVNNDFMFPQSYQSYVNGDFLSPQIQTYNRLKRMLLL